jgi:rhodanese-related sulfurtransferase
MNIFLEYILPIIIGLALGLLFLIIKDWFSIKVNPLDPETFKNTMRKGQLIDLRSPKQYQDSHIKGARNFKLSVIKKDQSKVRKDLPVYLYDETPLKAKKAARRLGLNGYMNVFYLNAKAKEHL